MLCGSRVLCKATSIVPACPGARQHNDPQVLWRSMHGAAEAASAARGLSALWILCDLLLSIMSCNAVPICVLNAHTYVFLPPPPPPTLPTAFPTFFRRTLANNERLYRTDSMRESECTTASLL